MTHVILFGLYEGFFTTKVIYVPLIHNNIMIIENSNMGDNVHKELTKYQLLKLRNIY